MPKKMTNSKYSIIVDTREKYPLDFSKDENAKEIILQKLDTADYSLKGFEEILAIERKASTSEISQNLLDERFYRELKRLQEFEFPFVLCEFSLTDIISFPHNSGIPQSQWSKLKVTGEFLLKQFMGMVADYKIPVLLCDNRTGVFRTCVSIFKKIHRQ